MKRIKRIIGLLCTVLLLSVFMCDIPTYAQESGIVVTPDTLGSDDSIYVIRITNKVVEIEDGSFSNLVNLREIRVDSDNQYYASYDGCLYDKDYTTLICIPQNTTSVQVKTSITSYTPHALDGLSQDRKDKLDQFLNDQYGNSYVPSSNPVSTYTNPSTSTTNNNISNNTNNETNNNTTPSVTSSIQTDFSEYVYTDSKGRVAFKYTGTGNSAIYIPEGVEYIAGFSSEISNFNYEITYVRLPSTLKSCVMAGFYYTEAGGYDTNFYNCLYQCPNLQTVEGGGKTDYMCDGNTVTRRGGITVWSNSAKIPYDAQAYINYNNK